MLRQEIPDVNEIISRILHFSTKYNNEKKTIIERIVDNRNDIQKNIDLIEVRNDINDVRIIKTWLINLMMRNVNANVAIKIERKINEYINSKDDLNATNYKHILSESGYRWLNSGIDVMSNVVSYFENNGWNWNGYFENANLNYFTNFQNDDLLKIKYISFKLRDLALSCFNKNYIAIDVHTARVATRLGLLNYGYSFAFDKGMEMGNNISDEKHYLFLHRLFVELRDQTNSEYSLSDLDRVFWYFGREKCNHLPKCENCPLKDICLTGKHQ